MSALPVENVASARPVGGHALPRKSPRPTESLMMPSALPRLRKTLSAPWRRTSPRSPTPMRKIHRPSAGINPSTHMNLPGSWSVKSKVIEGTPDAADISAPPKKERKRVILAVDDSEVSELALNWTLETILDAENDELQLLHIVGGYREDVQCIHSSSESSLEDDDMHVLPLPSAALEEGWATEAHRYLQTRFEDRLTKLGINYKLDLVKEYGPKTSPAIGHCICDAAEDVDADVVVVAHADAPLDFESKTSVSRFVANYCCRPVVMLNEQQLRHQKLASKTAAPEQPGRVMLFAMTRELAEMWAVDWVLKKIGHPEDQIHLAHVSKDLPQDPMMSFETLHLMQESMMHKGIHIQGHLVQAPAEDEEPSICVGDALSSLADQLGADMVFVVNHGEGDMDDFLWHSVTGRCAHLCNCPTIVLHSRRQPEGE